MPAPSNKELREERDYRKGNKELREERDHWRKLYLQAQREKELLELNFKKLDLKPGDTVVITAPGMIDFHTAERLKKHFEDHLPGVRAVVVADGLEVEIREEV